MKSKFTGYTAKTIFISGFVPLFIWMGIIYFFSSQPRIPITTSYVISFAIFKTAHLFEYAILYFLWVRFCIMAQIKHPFLVALMATILYAVTDELHQLFVPTREGKFRDIVVDSMGALSMYVCISKTKLRQFLPIHST